MHYKNKRTGKMCEVIKNNLVQVKYADNPRISQYIDKDDLVEVSENETVMREGTKFKVNSYGYTLELTVKTVGCKGHLPVLKTFENDSNNRYSDFNCHGKSIQELMKHCGVRFLSLVKV
jgi:hypothetical protein